jgi:hypothetical protein
VEEWRVRSEESGREREKVVKKDEVEGREGREGSGVDRWWDEV